MTEPKPAVPANLTERFVEAKVYVSHIRAVLRPGSTVRQHIVMSETIATPGDMSDWDDGELGLFIDECHFTLDDQSSRFDQVRTTAQILLPMAFALVVVFGTQLGRVADVRCLGVRLTLLALWFLGSALALAAGLGAAAVLTVRAQFGRVLPTLLSKEERPVRLALAQGYAGQMATGETTVSTRLTVIRDAVFLLATGGCLQLLVWIVLNVT